jgi:aminoglycoside phosphotransferase (APT) family kinase protein
MSAEVAVLSQRALRRVVDVVAPVSRVVGVEDLAGSFSNDSCRVELAGADGIRSRIVVRCYVDHGEAPERRATREFEALHLLRSHREVPTPEPLLLDADGRMLGSPGIVIGFIPGEVVPLEVAPRPWTRRCRKAAVTLARIHDISVDRHTHRHLIDANAEAVWFLTAEVPEFMRQHPDGATVWQTVHNLRRDVAAVEPKLIHLDYWSGNVLWRNDQLVGVVDWEEAGYGDPAIDVAYSLMELHLEGLDTDADDFLRTYVREAGRSLANLAYWKLAAAARPMIDLDGWLTRPHMAERFRRFIAAALREVH